VSAGENARSSLTFLEKLNKDGYRESVDKSKWLSRNDFNARVGKATTDKGLPYNGGTYVTRDPSEPPMLIKFRESSPRKWLNGNFKF